MFIFFTSILPFAFWWSVKLNNLTLAGHPQELPCRHILLMLAVVFCATHILGYLNTFIAEQVSTYHKKSKEDDTTAPNVCPATIILLPLKCRFKDGVTLGRYTHKHTRTERLLTYPYDFWASIMWGSK